MICITGALINACAPEACLEETEAFLKASFFSLSSNKKQAPDSLTIYGLNHASDKIYNKMSAVQPALFPLDKSADNCTFIIRINGTADTIRFSYTTQLHFISKECGYTVFHNLIDTPYYTKHEIDRITIAGRNITTANEENIRISY